MNQNLLPISLQADWRQSPDVKISSLLSQWLFESGSLTQRLKDHCDIFTVQILAKHVRQFTSAELEMFGCAQQRVQVREVLLHCDGKPWVYAQSVMPLDVNSAVVQDLIELGEKPLGELIFNVKGMSRSPIEVAKFEQNSEVALLSCELDQTSEHSLWGRRSLFTVDGYSLLVSEVFLPDSGIYHE